jgi:GT2 family glycosyltransferase
MQVSIIIINYNTFTLTSNCIRSVIENTGDVDYEIILVDNGSTECNPEIFLQEFPQLKLVKSSINRGFAYGNNLGIEKASGEYILLLNSDTILKEDSISKSLYYLINYENGGVLGCRMVFPEGKIQYTARRFKSVTWELLDLFRFIPMMIPYKKRSRLMLGKYFRCDENIECDWVNGAFFLFPRKIVEQLPEKKLNDRFFMYGEDQLWCEQIKNLGYKILFYAGTTIIHINGGSTDLSKQLMLRKTMMKHELEIMQLRKKKGIYYYVFVMIYGIKETVRNFIKRIVLKFSGKLVK